MAEWDPAEEKDFWAAYSRLRAAGTRSKLAMQQMRAILDASPDRAIQLGESVADDLESDPRHQAAFLSELATMMLNHGDADKAIDTSIRAALAGRESAGDSIVVATTMVDVFAESGRIERADDVLDTLDIIDRGGDRDSESTRRRRLVLRAGVLAVCGRVAESAALLDEAASILAGHCSYLERLELAAPRTRERALFSATRRGGSIRLLGLLGGGDVLNSPNGLRSLLRDHPFFDEALYEQSGERLIVDLPEFSLDFQWHANDDAAHAVRLVHDRFRLDDRRHIPVPPEDVANALIVLAIGDDLDVSDIVNTMIELSCVLDLDECVFFRQLGPISRQQNLPEVEFVDARFVEKAVNRTVGPVLKQAGFKRSSGRRFDMDSGGLGHYALVHFRIDDALTVAASASVYYRELMDPDSIEQFTNAKGLFRPKPDMAWGGTYCEVPRGRWACEAPTEDGVQAMVEQILVYVTDVVVPTVVRTSDPRQELRALEQSTEDLRFVRASPAANRCNAMTMDEIRSYISEVLDSE